MRAFAWVAGLAVGGALFAHSAPALADETPSGAPSAATAAPREAPLVWYGWQTLLVDGAVTLGFFAPNASGAQGFFAAGYVLGGPIVHIAHRRYGIAALSLAGRLLLPYVGGLVGATIAKCSSEQQATDYANGDTHSCETAPLLGTILGAGVGALSAMITDAAISWESAPAPDSADGRPPKTSWLVPVVSPIFASERSTGLIVGVAGAF